MAMIVFGALVFAALLIACALRASRGRDTRRANGAADVDSAYLLYTDAGGSAHTAVDSACAASHNVDCGSPGH